MPALPDLVSLDAVLTYVGDIGQDDASVLQDLIPAYSAWVRSYLSRDITSTTYETRRSGRGTFAMLLPQYPITGVSLLEIDGRAITSAPAWGQMGYTFDDQQIVLNGYCFTRSISNVHIVYTAGYDEVPADLAQAVVELVALRYKLRDKLEWSSKSLAGETISLVTKDMPAQVATVLNQYRSIVPL